MNLIKNCLIYLFLVASIYSCAQSKPLIRNIYATYVEHLPGNIPVDENGKEIDSRDTLIVIYVETTSNKIQWEKAWKNDKCYSILPALADTGYFDAGIKKRSNSKMIIRAAKGNMLWQLRLIPSENNIPAPSRILPGEILLRGIYHGNKFLQKTSKQTELNALPSV